MSETCKEKLHKIFLSISTIIILHGVALTVTCDGSINLAMLKFFTVLSNLLLCGAFIARLVRYSRNDTQYLSFSALISIAVTFMVYNFVLVPFDGADSVFVFPSSVIVFPSYENFVTHLLSTILAFASYLFFEKKKGFNFRHMLVGMAFPIIY